MSVHQAVPFSAPPVLPLVSYSSGRPRSWRELMREDADAAVLRLDGVVADPVVAAADADAAEVMRAGAVGAGARLVGVPAMAPDGVGSLRAAAGLLALASVDGLEVVNVAIRLVEVAVAVVVVAVPDVVLRQVGVEGCDAARVGGWPRRPTSHSQTRQTVEQTMLPQTFLP